MRVRGGFRTRRSLPPDDAGLVTRRRRRQARCGEGNRPCDTAARAAAFAERERESARRNQTTEFISTAHLNKGGGDTTRRGRGTSPLGAGGGAVRRSCGAGGTRKEAGAGRRVCIADLTKTARAHLVLVGGVPWRPQADEVRPRWRRAARVDGVVVEVQEDCEAGRQELTATHKIEAGRKRRITHVGIRIGLASSRPAGATKTSEI